jgi:hypothetical protein
VETAPSRTLSTPALGKDVWADYAVLDKCLVEGLIKGRSEFKEEEAAARMSPVSLDYVY